MKKILISVLIILLLILSYFALAKGIGFLKIKSINDMKNASLKLEDDFNQANELSNKTYPSEVEALENAIKQLKISKQEFDNKNLYSEEENALGSMEIRTYKIHYLWTILGNYRKDRGINSLTLDLKSTQTQDVYDLQFTLVGAYTNITDFLYDIENDEELNFEIKNFNISSISTTTTNNENQENLDEFQKAPDDNDSLAGEEENAGNSNQAGQKNENKNDLQAKFTVENIGITLD